MIVIQGDRRSGRTTVLLAALRMEPESMLLVANQQQRKYCIDQGKEIFDINLGNQIITVVDSQKIRGHHPPTKLYIDNLEHVLTAMFGVTPEVVTCEKHHNGAGVRAV